jgi:hypothetical protein
MSEEANRKDTEILRPYMKLEKIKFNKWIGEREAEEPI